jgi:N,N'-diacetyllegionaminate synthase
VKPSRKIFIIAEAGVNHNGSLELAIDLVDAAKKAGADAVKFQTFRADKIVTRKAGKAAYQKKHTPRGETQYEMLKRLELSREDHRELLDQCRRRKVAFMSSPFDQESADFLGELGLERFKVGSGEITNLPLLRHVAAKGRPVILSTGMSSLGEVEQAVETLRAAGCSDITLMHCTTQYPAPPEEVNLKAMFTMRAAFQVPVGYSDHTPGIEIPIAAAALGAEVLEKHFTLDKGLEGPDHKASLDPTEFQAMVRAVRTVEMALGDGVKRLAPSELPNRDVARKSVVAARPIKRGQRLTMGRLTIKRPGHGVQPADLEKVIGRAVNRDVEPDEVITWSLLR